MRLRPFTRGEGVVVSKFRRAVGRVAAEQRFYRDVMMRCPAHITGGGCRLERRTLSDAFREWWSGAGGGCLPENCPRFQP